MTWEEIYERIDELTEDIGELKASLEKSRAVRGGKENPADSSAQIVRLERRLKDKHLQVLAMQAELRMRPALSLGCLFFVLVGCPVGIWFSRSDYLSSFI